jgi:hypothetical protein
MMHVCTTAERNGIVNVFHPMNTGPTRAKASVWVYVVRGTVGVGVGNGGQTSINTQTTGTGAWEHLEVNHDGGPANEFIVYSTSTHGACFYVHAPCVE